jgi:hypothetical protein
MLSEIEFQDCQYRNIMELVKAVETEKIDLFNDVQGINNEYLEGDVDSEMIDHPLDWKTEDILLLRKIRNKEIPLKFGDLKQIRLMHILRGDYLGEKYCEYLNKNNLEMYSTFI